jgi:hypothetical protein
MFDANSRYVDADTFVVKDARGRDVRVVQPPPPPQQSLLGIHVLREGERMDYLAAKYLGDAAGYWRIDEQNGVMLPDALTEQPESEIPVKAR